MSWRRCRQCGTEYPARSAQQKFCSAACAKRSWYWIHFPATTALRRRRQAAWRRTAA